MNDERNPASQPPPASQPNPQPKDGRIDEARDGTVKPDRGGEAELTEKEEQKRGGANRSTPGPIYDV
ncbi:hypothetical protein FBZ82_101682 [Azospirillum brasilense]|uniref:Uncharacterized protein n=1 Tax=Azospirillum brasilense TaxID=192 RepID=A0A560BPZ4_AZOBR|nr:hypothetical protein [Azospirillum brasilense]TWA74666.1 hypothetical protein FBZ82_101682 [Azospirillum brasilense]